jgi:hypothetical protein
MEPFRLKYESFYSKYELLFYPFTHEKIKIDKTRGGREVGLNEKAQSTTERCVNE